MSVSLGANCVLAQNLLVTDQFTTDPTARVFEGKMEVAHNGVWGVMILLKVYPVYLQLFNAIQKNLIWQ